MDLQTFTFEYESLGLDESTIEKYMGYEGPAPDPIPSMIEDVLANVKPYCDIQGGYRIFESFSRDKKNHLATLDDVTFNIKPIVSNLIRKAEKAALFVCTAGEGVSRWSKELMSEGDLMKGLWQRVA